MTDISDVHYAGPTGRELPGEHWNARIIREENAQDCGTAEPAGATHKLYAEPVAHDHLAAEIADLLDHALHLEGCYIGPDETHCVCIIGKLRALLPLCNEPRTQGGYLDGEATYWRCVSVVHPAAPDRHTFGQV